MSLGPHKLLPRIVEREASRLGRNVDYIEVGVCLGNSALAVLQTGKIARYTGLDNWQDSFDRDNGDKHLGPDEIRKKLDGFGCDIELVTGDSRQTLQELGSQHVYDVGFVDGNHSDAACLTDMKNMLPRIRKGGVMLVDDIRHPGHTLEPVVEAFAKQHSLSYKLHSDHLGVAELSL